MAKAVAGADAGADAAAAAETAKADSRTTWVASRTRAREFTGAREASDEEREFHAQMTNGNRGGSHEHSEPAHQEAPHAPRLPRIQREPEREPPREQRNEGTQAPLDLPPPPPTKPFVVWSSSPSDAPPVTRRDE